MTDDALRFWFQHVHQRRTENFYLAEHLKIIDAPLYYSFNDDVLNGKLPSVYLKETLRQIRLLMEQDPTR